MENQETNIVKRNDMIYLYSSINKELQIIKEKTSEKEAKKNSINKLYSFIITDKPEIKSENLDELIFSFHKDFLSIALYSETQLLRELSLKILIYIYSHLNTSIRKLLPFVFSDLVIKLECSDLEGWGHLPEDIRPTPSQKPHKIVNLTETCEEIRVLYLSILESIFINDNIDLDDYDNFINDIVNILRCLVMDPSVIVIKKSCELIKFFAIKFKSKLYYFNSILGRSLFLPLCSKQSKIKILGLEAIDSLMECSPFKKNFEILEGLIGFSDPNLVPIKDFYEPSTKFNYFAMLIRDGNFLVRKKFLEMISNWLIYKEDRYDFESRVLPYLLTGLFDENEEVAIFTLGKLEEIGRKQEKDNEKDMREEVQYGIDSKWTNNYIDYRKLNKMRENSNNNNILINTDDYLTNLNYPFPLKTRPKRGSRYLVKKYLRRYIKNLCKEFDCIDYSIKLKTANLMLYSISFSEELVTEFLSEILLCLFKELSKPIYTCTLEDAVNVNINFKNQDNSSNFSYIAIKEALEIKAVLIKSCKMLGRFCDYESIIKIVYPTLKGDMFGMYNDINKGALISLMYIIKGHSEHNIFSLGEYGKNLHSLVKIIVPDNCIYYSNSFLKKEDNESYNKLKMLIEKEIYANPNNNIEEELKNINDKEGCLYTDSNIALVIIKFYTKLAELCDLNYFNSNSYIDDICSYINSNNSDGLGNFIIRNNTNNFSKDSSEKQKIKSCFLKTYLDNVGIDIIQSIYSHFLLCICELNLIKNDGSENTKILAEVNKRIASIDKNIKNTSNHIETNTNISFFEYKTKITLNEIYDELLSNNEKKDFLFPHNKNFKLFFFIVKSSNLLNNYKNIGKLELIFKILLAIFNQEGNYLVHNEALLLYKNITENKDFEFLCEENSTIVEYYFEIVKNVIIDYDTIDYSESKVKFVDLLKSEKELNKQQKKTVKYMKSQMKVGILKNLKYIVNRFVSNINEMNTNNDNKNTSKNVANFLQTLNIKQNTETKKIEKEETKTNANITNNNNNKDNTVLLNSKVSKSQEIFEQKYLNTLIEFLNDQKILDSIYSDIEQTRILFSEILLTHSVKLLLSQNKQKINKITKHIKKHELTPYENYLSYLKKVESYFLQYMSDNSQEVRKNTLKAFNCFFSIFEISDFFEPLKGMFSKQDMQSADQQVVLKALSYLQDENEYIKRYFDKFDDVFAFGVRVYIEERAYFSTEIEIFMRNVIEKFPIYVINQYMKYQEKGMFNRVDVLQKVLKKYLK